MVEATPDLEEDVGSETAAECPTLEGEGAVLDQVASAIEGESLESELAVLAVLADETRYRILRILLESDERCVCELDALLEVSDSAVSHALRKLERADLVSRRKEGRWRIYAPTERAERLVSALRTEVDG